MPKILSIKEVAGAAWVCVGKPGDFPSGMSLWTPDEQAQNRNDALEDAARVADATQLGVRIAEAIRTLKACDLR